MTDIQIVFCLVIFSFILNWISGVVQRKENKLQNKINELQHKNNKLQSQGIKINTDSINELWRHVTKLENPKFREEVSDE